MGGERGWWTCNAPYRVTYRSPSAHDTMMGVSLLATVCSTCAVIDVYKTNRVSGWFHSPTVSRVAMRMESYTTCDTKSSFSLVRRFPCQAPP